MLKQGTLMWIDDIILDLVVIVPHTYDVTYPSKQPIMMTTPLPYYAGYYMDVLCFVQSSTTMSPTKSTTKHLKSYVVTNVNDGNKEMVPEVKY